MSNSCEGRKCSASVQNTVEGFSTVQYPPHLSGEIHMKYEAPSIKTVGSVADVTLAQGLQGHDDRILFLSWGTDPKVS